MRALTLLNAFACAQCLHVDASTTDRVELQIQKNINRFIAGGRKQVWVSIERTRVRGLICACQSSKCGDTESVCIQRE